MTDVDGDRVLRQRLPVSASRDGRLELQADRASACAACAVKAGCGTAVLTRITGTRSMHLSVPGTAKPGDEVVVAMEGDVFLRAAGLTYAVPLLGLVGWVALAAILHLPDAATALGCAPVLAASFWPLYRAERTGRLQERMRVETVLPRDARG